MNEPKHHLTIKEIQSMILFLTDKDIRADKVKAYLTVKRSKLTGE